TVLITRANGYIRNAVAKAFARAGWKTYGLVRRAEDASDLARHEIHPIIGAPKDFGPSPDAKSKHFTHPVFDVVVSNTEDWSNYAKHFEEVRSMLLHIGKCSNQAGIRPLVLFSSGCKDYGMTGYHDDPALTPHTETSPLDGIALLLPRAQASASLLHAGPEQPFNISNALYETTTEICKAVARSYNLSIEYVPPKPLHELVPGMVDAILNYSQWVSSDKIRQLTGWTEKRTYFADGIDEYCFRMKLQ
ncbi:hypothetical protein BO78DRAFT_451432, partial [Aspergillus sclerotiicarbonarius CBS 121057]